MAPPKKWDHEQLYSDFRRIKRQNPSYTLKEFCKNVNSVYAVTSREFAKIKRRMQLEAFQNKNIGILLDAQKNVATAIKDKSLDGEFQAKFSLETYKAVADRAGFSPQAVTQATQVNIQVNVPALFANQDNQEDLKALLQGDKPQIEN